MRPLVIGTRKSKLARIQTDWVIDALREVGVSNPIRVLEIDTMGDQKLNVSLPTLGGGGVFLEEIERELLDEKIDFAVHSLKDIPVELPAGLVIASIPVREDHRDALLNKEGHSLATLPPGAVVGTSSLRRVAQLKRQRPDIKTSWIRGPIDSRIAQMVAGNFDAIVLAMAGLNRLSIGQNYIGECLSDKMFLPAMGQGALAIECRETDQEIIGILAKINDRPSMKAVLCERAFSRCFEEGEQAPIGAYAYVEQDIIHLHGMVMDAAGTKVIEHEATGTDVTEVAQEVANALINQGALDMIAIVNEGLQENGR